MVEHNVPEAACSTTKQPAGRQMDSARSNMLALKSKPVPSPHNVYGFRTTPPKAVVEPLHPKAMPLILMTDEERDVWNAGAVG